MRRRSHCKYIRIYHSMFWFVRKRKRDVQKPQSENQRQSNLLPPWQLDLPHRGNRHQPHGEIGNDVHNRVADRELPEIKISPFRRPERADRLAVEDGEECHDNRPDHDQSDHPVS